MAAAGEATLQQRWLQMPAVDELTKLAARIPAAAWSTDSEQQTHCFRNQPPRQLPLKFGKVGDGLLCFVEHHRT